MTDTAPVHPIKSELDNREYSYITLDNGMNILLVSDPTSEKASASMDVGVGSFSDPDDIPGLAHFLEHMLFLGTEKYPDENEYNSFLQKHGGRSNAYTSTESTNYFFDVLSEHLEGALDRFGQFFISPMFTEAATERELKAVDSENAKNLQADPWRMLQMERSASRPDHPFHKFSTGNLDTLLHEPKARGVNTRDTVIAFYKEHYCPSIMKLSILGRDPIEVLDKWVRGIFADVKTCNSKANLTPAWLNDAPPSFPYGPEQLQQFVRAVPVKEARTLDMNFQLPSQMNHYLEKPTHYISHMIGHESRGSILAALKAKGWANELSSGVGVSTRLFSVFRVSIDLTEDGLTRVNDVISIVFDYIELLRREGVQEWIFDEVKAVSEMQFRFKDKPQPIACVEALARHMQLYDKRHVLQGPYIFENFDAQLIHDALDRMTVDNLRVMVTNNGFSSLPDLLAEKWYGTQYTTTSFDANLASQWRRDSTSTLDSELAVCARNPFVATDFDVHEAPPLTGEEDFPTLIRTTDRAKWWHKHDRTFNRPKAVVILNVVTAAGDASLRSAVLTTMFCEMVQDHLNEYTYYADIAGLMFELRKAVQGVKLVVRGFNQKLPLLLAKVVTAMVNFDPDETRFTLIREQLVRQYKNFFLDQPYTHAQYTVSYTTTDAPWHVAKKLEIIDELTSQDLRAFVKELFREVQFEGIAHGNLRESDAVAIISAVEGAFDSSDTLEKYPEQRMVDLGKSRMFVHREEEPNKDNNNSAMYLYYQVGVENMKHNVLLEVVSQLTREPCFNQLRTQEQLGYLVWSGVRSALCVQGFRILIQSATHDPLHVTERAVSFIDSFEETLVAMSDDDFNTHIQSLVNKKLEKDKTLVQEASRHWGEVACHKNMFDRASREASELKTISKEEVLQFYRDYFVTGGSMRSVFAAQVFAQQHALPELGREEDVSVIVVEDKERFKKSMPYFPFVC
eukprot:TRINITY_DN6412_c0_g1_i1.p1 TRINITY_DN6412_c0_g1~~TRINITY_DN6412_c0_g1_i1.p1  ORF type:complete len:1087 (+),score=280.46 TRINITY_DN6412_c0_g1_i1:370-3261(+)